MRFYCIIYDFKHPAKNEDRKKTKKIDTQVRYPLYRIAFFIVAFSEETVATTVEENKFGTGIGIRDNPSIFAS